MLHQQPMDLLPKGFLIMKTILLGCLLVLGCAGAIEGQDDGAAGSEALDQDIAQVEQPLSSAHASYGTSSVGPIMGFVNSGCLPVWNQITNNPGNNPVCVLALPHDLTYSVSIDSVSENAQLRAGLAATIAEMNTHLVSPGGFNLLPATPHVAGEIVVRSLVIPNGGSGIENYTSMGLSLPTTVTGPTPGTWKVMANVAQTVSFDIDLGKINANNDGSAGPHSAHVLHHAIAHHFALLLGIGGSGHPSGTDGHYASDRVVDNTTDKWKLATFQTCILSHETFGGSSYTVTGTNCGTPPTGM